MKIRSFFKNRLRNTALLLSALAVVSLILHAGPPLLRADAAEYMMSYGSDVTGYHANLSFDNALLMQGSTMLSFTEDGVGNTLTESGTLSEGMTIYLLSEFTEEGGQDYYLDGWNIATTEEAPVAVTSTPHDDSMIYSFSMPGADVNISPILKGKFVMKAPELPTGLYSRWNAPLAWEDNTAISGSEWEWDLDAMRKGTDRTSYQDLFTGYPVVWSGNLEDDSINRLSQLKVIIGPDVIALPDPSVDAELLEEGGIMSLRLRTEVQVGLLLEAEYGQTVPEAFAAAEISDTPDRMTAMVGGEELDLSEAIDTVPGAGSTLYNAEFGTNIVPVALQIIKAKNVWTLEPSVDDAETEDQPGWARSYYDVSYLNFGQAKFQGPGEPYPVKFTSLETDVSKTLYTLDDIEEAPSGSYTMTVEVKETETYEGLSIDVPFTISDRLVTLNFYYRLGEDGTRQLFEKKYAFEAPGPLTITSASILQSLRDEYGHTEIDPDAWSFVCWEMGEETAEDDYTLKYDLDFETFEINLNKGEVDVTAIYEKKADFFTLSITGGKASDPADETGYRTDEVVEITAEEPEDGYVFEKWILLSGDAVIADTGEETTTVIIGRADSEIKASFRKETTVEEAVKLLQKIFISSRPAKTTYKLGENFHSAGLVVKGRFVATASDYTGDTGTGAIPDGDAGTGDIGSVTDGDEGTGDIGAIGTGSVSAGKVTEEVLAEEDYELDTSAFDSSRAGTYEITVRYTGDADMAEDASEEDLTDSFTVTVEDAEGEEEGETGWYTTGIRVKNRPAKTSYQLGEDLNTAGLVVVARQKDRGTGSSRDVILEADEYDLEYDLGSTGSRSVKVTHIAEDKNENLKEFSARFSVTVKSTSGSSSGGSGGGGSSGTGKSGYVGGPGAGGSGIGPGPGMGPGSGTTGSKDTSWYQKERVNLPGQMVPSENLLVFTDRGQEAGPHMGVRIPDTLRPILKEVWVDYFRQYNGYYLDFGTDLVANWREQSYLTVTGEEKLLTLNGEPVPYYLVSTAGRTNDDYSYGYVPAMLGGQKILIQVIKDAEHPEGLVVGYKRSYEDISRYRIESAELVPPDKGLKQFSAGDQIRIYFGQYRSDGSFDRLLNGAVITYTGEEFAVGSRPLLNNQEALALQMQVNYRLTDLYLNDYYTEALDINHIQNGNLQPEAVESGA